MSRKLTFLSSAAALGGAMLISSNAFAAGPDACGGIELTSIGECHFEFDGGCEAKCEPVRFVAACDGVCDASIDASCDASCNVDCRAECDVDPGRFDCRASCTSDCRANAVARCGSDSECRSYFEAQCSSSCEAECEAVPPSADCEAQCEGCCSASCDVEANFECNLDCTLDMEGGCEVDCRQPTGALFCDGQYIAVQDLPECLEYLYENFEINLEYEVTGQATITCAAAPNSLTDGSGIAASMLAALGFAFTRRRRRRF